MSHKVSVRVAIVDDSEIARAAMSRALSRASGIVVAGAFESVSALEASGVIENVHVVLLDMWMPERSGLSAIRDLASRTRVLVISDTASDSSIAREARAQGASAFFSKSAIAKDAERAALFEAIRSHGSSSKSVQREALPVLIVVGSTGAPRALEKLLPPLVGTQAAIVIAQHSPPGGEREIARWVTSLGLAATSMRPGDAIEAGKVLVAPGGTHARLNRTGTFRVEPAGAQEVSPSADVLLDSAVWLERRLVAIVLSGMGHDGARGIASVARVGATCLVQEPTDCVADSMPRSALAATRLACAVRLEHLGAHARTFLTRIR
jgi:two-component system chemotaxis response regulator CheB